MEWLLGDSFVACEDCQELYDGQPPCQDCTVPADREGAVPYFEAIAIWQNLSFYSRPAALYGLLPLPLSEVAAYLAALGESKERLNEVLWVEAIAYPLLCKKLQSQKQHE